MFEHPKWQKLRDSLSTVLSDTMSTGQIARKNSMQASLMWTFTSQWSAIICGIFCFGKKPTSTNLGTELFWIRFWIQTKYLELCPCILHASPSSNRQAIKIYLKIDAISIGKCNQNKIIVVKSHLNSGHTVQKMCRTCKLIETVTVWKYIASAQIKYSSCCEVNLNEIPAADTRCVYHQVVKRSAAIEL